MKKILSILLLALLTVPMVTAGAGELATVFDPITGERKVVEIGSAGAFDGGFLLETPTNNFNQMEGEDIGIPCTTELCGEEELQLGASVSTRYRTRLTSSMNSTQTTIPVSSITSFDGTALTMALLDDVVFLTAEPGTSREEIIKCTAISSLSWTSCTRGLAFTGTSEATVANNRKAHNAGSVIVMSNVHYVYEQLTDKDSTETITGEKTFSSINYFDVLPETTTSQTATTTNQFATKEYVDNTVNQGAATSSETISGISELATAAEIALGADLVTDSPLVIGSYNATSTPDGTSGAANRVVVSEADGKINQLWLDTTEAFSLTDFTSASTTLATKILITGSATSTNTFVFENDVLGVDGNTSLHTCGETIAANEFVYSSATSTRILLTDGSIASTTVPFLGIALDGCDILETTYVQTDGIYTNSGASYTIDAYQYISDTAGARSETVGTVQGTVGRAISTTEIDMSQRPYSQYIGSASDTTDTINDVPMWANSASIRLTGAGSLHAMSGDVTIYRVGATSGTVWDAQDASGAVHQNQLTVSWSGNTITCSYAANATAVACTAYYYY